MLQNLIGQAANDFLTLNSIQWPYGFTQQLPHLLDLHHLVLDALGLWGRHGLLLQRGLHPAVGTRLFTHTCTAQMHFA